VQDGENIVVVDLFTTAESGFDFSDVYAEKASRIYSIDDNFADFLINLVESS